MRTGIKTFSYDSIEVRGGLAILLFFFKKHIIRDRMINKLASLERGKNLNISSENTKTELPAGQLNGHEEREPISPAGEDRSSTHKRGVTPETSINTRPLGWG